VLGAQAHDAIQAREAGLQEVERSLVALEVAVVDRHARAVDAEAGEQLGVAFVEEAGEQAIEEALGALGADDVGDRRAHQALRARIAGHEVLHVHPAAHSDAPQHDTAAVGVDDGVALHAQRGTRRLRHWCSFPESDPKFSGAGPPRQLPYWPFVALFKPKVSRKS
jgi:hypothetical protein